MVGFVRGREVEPKQEVIFSKSGFCNLDIVKPTDEFYWKNAVFSPNYPLTYSDSYNRWSASLTLTPEDTSALDTWYSRVKVYAQSLFSSNDNVTFRAIQKDSSSPIYCNWPREFVQQQPVPLAVLFCRTESIEDHDFEPFSPEMLEKYLKEINKGCRFGVVVRPSAWARDTGAGIQVGVSFTLERVFRIHRTN